MVNLLTQRGYKQNKKEIVEESALYVGYYDDVLSHIPEYALFEAMKEISSNGWLNRHTDDSELRNMLVTESIRHVNYQDFKELAPYFFNFPTEKRSEYYRVQPIPVDREYYERLQKDSRELFALKQDIKQLNNNLVSKIEELETDRVANNDKVIGVDMVNQELLLLRTPENAYIDDWEVRNDNLLIDYHSRLSPQEQVIDSLVNAYPEIQHKIYEYVLDNDLYRGYADVDRYAIAELDPTELPNFDTQQAYYDFATGFDSFKENYSNFESYIVARYEFVYEYSLSEFRYYAPEFLRDNQAYIDDVLAEHGKELIWHEVRGYSQGDRWDLAYLRDVATESSESVAFYLEHEVGAWYRGSYTELVTVPFESIDLSSGYNGRVNDVYQLDNELLWGGDSLDKAKELYPELSSFESVDSIEKTQALDKVSEQSRGVRL